MGDLGTNQAHEYLAWGLFSKKNVLFAAEVFANSFPIFKYFKIIFLCEQWLLKLLVDLCDTPKTLNALFDPVPTGHRIDRLIAQRIPYFCLCVGLQIAWIHWLCPTVMPSQKIVIIESLQTLEKIVTRLSAHFSNQVQKIYVTVDGENCVWLEKVFL